MKQSRDEFYVGMPMSEVLRVIESPVEVDEAGVEYDGKPTPEQMEKDAKFSIRLPKKHVSLQFNHYRKLIRIVDSQ